MSLSTLYTSGMNGESLRDLIDVWNNDYNVVLKYLHFIKVQRRVKHCIMSLSTLYTSGMNGESLRDLIDVWNNDYNVVLKYLHFIY
jgi:predicted nucleic-acid-binding Zn-ribbon protein